MKVLLLVTTLSFLLFASSVFALNITVSTDKTKLLLGENFTLSGTITYDNGTAGVFDYRAAVVAPKGIIICDSHKTQTASDGSFSLFCNVPTKESANASGIPAALTRSVMPLRAGVAVLDPDKFVVVKKYAKEILAINPDKFKAILNTIANDFDDFNRATGNILQQCDNLVNKSQKFNLTDISKRCQKLNSNISGIMSDLSEISNQTKQLISNLNATNILDLRDKLSIIKSDLKDLRNEINDVRTSVNSIRWNVLKEVTAIRKGNEGEITSNRGNLSERLKEFRNKTGSE